VLAIPELVSPALAGELCGALAKARFVDGTRTANHNRELKHNLELADMSELPPELVGRMLREIRGNALLATWALPRRSAPFLFNRYDAGMYYRDHVDNAVGVIERDHRRVDLSLTLFLSPPDAYDGGELVVGSTRFKLPAGHAVVYGSGSIHRVEEVTRGTRLCAVTWIESLVASHEQRQLLFDLRRAVEMVRADERAELRTLLAKCEVGLMRMWMS
jgi:PKHD-type hydroxylase